MKVSIRCSSWHDVELPDKFSLLDTTSPVILEEDEENALWEECKSFLENQGFQFPDDGECSEKLIVTDISVPETRGAIFEW